MADRRHLMRPLLWIAVVIVWTACNRTPAPPSSQTTPAPPSSAVTGTLAVDEEPGDWVRPARDLASSRFSPTAMVLGLALLTDYPAGVFRKVSFKTHRTADIMQAALAGLGPIAMGFAQDPEATYFYGQAASEVGVIAATDWDADTSRV